MPLGPFDPIPPREKIRRSHINDLRTALTGIQDAYDVAVANGFTGTRGQWLDSLKGEKGDPGVGLAPIGSAETYEALPEEGNTVGDVRTVDADGRAYRWSGSAWVDIGQWRGDPGELVKAVADTYYAPKAATEAALERVDPGAAGTVGRRLGIGIDGAPYWSRDVYNVLDYGAIGDGTLHPLSERFGSLAAAQAVYPHATSLTQQIDWAAIQLAIDTAHEAGGGVVLVPAGIYWAHQLVVRNYVWLRGTGWTSFGLSGSATRLRQVAGTNTDFLIVEKGAGQDAVTHPFCGPFGISGMVLLGDTASTAGHAINTRAEDGTTCKMMDLTTIEKLQIRFFRGDGVRVNGGTPANLRDIAGLWLGGYTVNIIDDGADTNAYKVHNISLANISGDGNLGYAASDALEPTDTRWGGAVVRISGAKSIAGAVLVGIKSEQREHDYYNGGVGNRYAVVLHNCENTVTIAGLTHISNGTAGSLTQTKKPGDAILISGSSRPKLQWSGVGVRVLAGQTSGADPNVVYDGVSGLAVAPLGSTHGSYATSTDVRLLSRTSTARYHFGTPESDDVVPSGANPVFQIGGATPVLSINETDAPADEKLWAWYPNAGDLALRTYKDDGSFGESVLILTRNGTDVTLATVFARFAVGAGDTIQTGRNTTANRPSAGTAGQGAMFFDTTLNKPIWSDGTNWRDAAGTVV